MDRNAFGVDIRIIDLVALRKESVDRNVATGLEPSSFGVALRKESVDRNYHRRRKYLEDVAVALRKESVDRNCVILII